MNEAGQSTGAVTVGLPPMPFLYTLDQIAALINVSEEHLRHQYIHFVGRTNMRRGEGKLVANDIAPNGEKPDWRVAEGELIRWLRHRGFKVRRRIPSY